MLESAGIAQINELRVKDGRSFQMINVADMLRGVLIRVTTRSKNDYLFEIVDPKRCIAKVVRCESRQFAAKAGYRGERPVSQYFEIGKQIFHGDSHTSAVIKITIINLLKT